MELNSRVTALALCLTYALVCQTRLTAPEPGRVSRQAQQHMGRTIFSHPKSRHRPAQSSTLICFSLHCSLSRFFMSFPQLPPSIPATFPLSPTAPIHLCPCLPSLQSFLLYHCRAPHCFSPSRAPVLSYLPKHFFFCLMHARIFV